MKIPTIVKVGGYDIKILLMEEMESFAHGIYGHFSPAEMTIRINKELHKHRMINTLWHEIKHAAWDIGDLGEDADEEKAVTVLSNMECAILRDNPELLTFMKECLK